MLEEWTLNRALSADSGGRQVVAFTFMGKILLLTYLSVELCQGIALEILWRFQWLWGRFKLHQGIEDEYAAII